MIAHFSDVHALSLEGARLWEFASKRIAGFINVSLRRKKKHAVALFEGIAADLNRQLVPLRLILGCHPLPNAQVERIGR